MFLRFYVTFCLLAGCVLSQAAEAPAKPAMRVLRDECIGCHKPGKAKGGLIMTTREKLMNGGDSGPAVVEGKGADSALVQVLAEGGDPHMPPRKQLGPEQIACLTAWIDAKAEWDATVFDEPPPIKPIALGAMPKTYKPVLAIALAPDEKHLAVARANQVCVYDLGTASHPLDQTLAGHTEAIESLAWSPDGKWIVSGGFRSLKVWDTSTWREIKSLSTSLIGNITALAISPDNLTLFATDGEPGTSGFIHRIAFTEGKLLGTWKAHDDAMYGLCLSADGKSLASAAADKLARLWNTADGKLVGTYEGHTNHVLAVAFNKDATQLATASADKEVKVWDVKSRNQDVVLGDKRIAFTALAWSADGTALLCVNDKGSGAIYRDLQKHDGSQRSDTGKERRLESAGVMLNCCAVTKDSKAIFCGGQDGTIYLWNDSGRLTGKIAPPP